LNDLAHLNPQQREAVTYDQGPLLVIAGAGSGKTRVITERIVHLIAQREVPPHRILAMTFTNKAATEMRDRIGRSVAENPQALTIGTFHAFCARFLRMEMPLLNREGHFLIADAKDQADLIKSIIKSKGLNTKDVSPTLIKGRISRQKNAAECFDPHYYHTFEDPVEQAVAEEYEAQLLKQNALDFDDLLLYTNLIFSRFEDRRDAYRRRYPHLLIDEFQDTNRSQFALIRHLCADTPQLCAVGDEDQSIYSWRGADIRNIQEFETAFPGTKIVKLEQNYRSTQPILHYANAVIERNADRRPKHLWTDRQGGSEVRYALYPHPSAEAGQIASKIRNANPSETQAILYRSNYLSRPFEEALRSLGIPYRMVGGMRFYDRKEIKDLLSYMRMVVNDRDFLSFQRALQVPPKGIGERTIEKLFDLFSQCGSLKETVARVPHSGVFSGSIKEKVLGFCRIFDTCQQWIQTDDPAIFLEKLLDRIEYRAFLRKEDQLSVEQREDNINELLLAAREMVHQGVGQAEGFLDLTALLGDQDTGNEESSRVSLMTVHAAKGLEFDHVYVVALEEGVFPNARSLLEEGDQEERRLFYVALTRARNTLHLSSCEIRSSYHGTFRNTPSSFILQSTQTTPSNHATRTSMTPEQSGRHTQMPVQVGDRVHHNHLGDGVVNMVSAHGSDFKVGVRFAIYGFRLLLWSKAPIKRLTTP
jgi:DNA helicase-2/ATP-dependent DNA helicase PcrA